MSTPNPITWITPAGNLGWIAEGIFYQVVLEAATPKILEITVTNTELVTNLITCNSTADLQVHQSVIFTGTVFGGLENNTAYYINHIQNATQFTISLLPFESAATVPLTTASGNCVGEVYQSIYYSIIAGELPPGIQCAFNGIISGTPNSLASVQGVPLPVGANQTFKWTVQAYTEIEVNGVEQRDRINDRTFELTVVVAPGPTFVTPQGLVASYYDSDEVNFQFEYIEPYEPDDVIIDVIEGSLPGGLILSPLGLLTGYVEPIPDVLALPGFDQPTSSYDTIVYDHLGVFQSRNYQFTLRISNGRKSSIRIFNIFVYSRNQMTVDDAVLIDNNTFITADATALRAPFLLNAEPSNLGTHRTQNYFAYQFQAGDYDRTGFTYAISVNQGFGLVPGLSLDPVSGWYYGYVPDQGVTETTYSFYITVYETDPITPQVTCVNCAANVITVTGTDQIVSGQPLVFLEDYAGLTANVVYYVNQVLAQDVDLNQTYIDIQSQTLTNSSFDVSAVLAIECTASSEINNTLTCFSTDVFEVGQPIRFTGTVFGGVSNDVRQIYYVYQIVSSTEFQISENQDSANALALTTGSGSMLANMLLASRQYPFDITIVGAVDTEIIWHSPPDSAAKTVNLNGVATVVYDMGSMDNGDVSLFAVAAENLGGRELQYRLSSGAYNRLPQGLTLLPSGEIAGRVSFDTFALDLGSTTFDTNYFINRNLSTLRTTFDADCVFTVNAFAPENSVPVYKVSKVKIDNGGTGYSSINTPIISVSVPIGANAVQAQIGNVTVSGGVIQSVEVETQGDGYTSPAVITVTQGFGGSGAVLTAVMQRSGTRDLISVDRLCSITVDRRYNKPYQNLYIRAMPPQADRELIDQLLTNQEIFVPDYIYRPSDTNFGLSRQVTYYHAYGLAPDTFDQYVLSLYENHYLKNLILGSIRTAVARDPVTNEILYEVVYSAINDNLVNAQGQSVSKIVNLPYPIVDPSDGSTVITQVYPNSLINMRDQVVSVVGQISNKIPLWMTSKQVNGRVLGFTPAWVICYTKPGRSNNIAYKINRYFGVQLNRIDFEVDRYILDRVLSVNWDTVTQQWTPESNLTTFDRFVVGSRQFIGTVDVATNLAWSDVNGRTVGYIQQLGGLDGIVQQLQNNTLIFAKQQDYDGPPGSSYATTAQAWQTYPYPFDSATDNGQPGSYDSEPFDNAFTVPGGDPLNCTATSSSTNLITCDSVEDIRVNQPIQFVENVIGGLVTDQVYYVRSVPSSTTFQISESPGGAVKSLTTAAGTMTARPANQRMAIYRINISEQDIVTLTLIRQTYSDEFVQITRGTFFLSAYLYYPSSPGTGLTRVSWLPLATQSGSVTTFDQNSMQFVEPVDMYDPSDRVDKYLVFPKQNILV